MHIEVKGKKLPNKAEPLFYVTFTTAESKQSVRLTLGEMRHLRKELNIAESLLGDKRKGF